MAFKIDHVDLTPPPIDDEVRFRTWLIENIGFVHNTLKDGFTGIQLHGNDTNVYEFGVLLSVTPTEIFDDEFAAEFA